MIGIEHIPMYGCGWKRHHTHLRHKAVLIPERLPLLKDWRGGLGGVVSGVGRLVVGRHSGGVEVGVLGAAIMGMGRLRFMLVFKRIQLT